MFIFAYEKIRLRFIQFAALSSLSLFFWALGSSIGFYQNQWLSLHNRLRIGSISLVFLVVGYTLFVIGVKTTWDASSIVAVTSTGSIIGLLAHGALTQDPQIMAFTTNGEVIYVTKISMILVISGVFLGAVVVVSVREYASQVLKRSLWMKSFRQRISFIISMIIIGLGIFAYLMGIMLSSLKQGIIWFHITVFGGIMFSLGFFYLSIALYVSPIIFLRIEPSVEMLIEQKILSGAILTLDFDGPTPLFYEGYRFVQDPASALVKLSIGYMTMIAQGESFPEGVYLLPFPENKKYESLVISKFLTDPLQKDERFKGLTYTLFVITYPRALANLFNHRELAKKALEEVSREINILQDIKKETLEEFLQSFVNKAFKEIEMINES